MLATLLLNPFFYFWSTFAGFSFSTRASNPPSFNLRKIMLRQQILSHFFEFHHALPHANSSSSVFSLALCDFLSCITLFFSFQYSFLSRLRPEILSMQSVVLFIEDSFFQVDPPIAFARIDWWHPWVGVRREVKYYINLFKGYAFK